MKFRLKPRSKQQSCINSTENSQKSLKAQFFNLVYRKTWSDNPLIFLCQNERCNFWSKEFSISNLKAFKKCFLSVHFCLCGQRERLIFKCLSFPGMEAISGPALLNMLCATWSLCQKKAFKLPFRYTEKSQPNSALWSWSLTSHRAATKLRGFTSEVTDGKMVATSINPALSLVL